jgi:hypothetical protein
MHRYAISSWPTGVSLDNVGMPLVFRVHCLLHTAKDAFTNSMYFVPKDDEGFDK